MMQSGPTSLRRLYFHHIPKTAGTTLRNHLILHLGQDRVAPMLRSGSFGEALREYRRFDAITGHLAAIPGDSLPADRLSITLIRDPVDRALSEFFFMRTVHVSGVRADSHNSQTIDEWVSSRTEADVGSCNAHVEALWPFGWSSQYRPPMAERLQAAKDALDRFDIVGLQHRLHETIAILDYWMRWPAPDSLPVDNPTPMRVALGDLAPGTRARLHALLAPDIELFEYAKRCFERRRLSVLISAAGLHSSNGAENDRAPVQIPQRANAMQPDHDCRYATDLPVAAGTHEIDVEAVVVTGDISGSEFVQTGEWVTIRIDLRSAIDEPNLTAGIAIRDHSGALVFGTNTLLLRRRYSVSPGRYAVSFRFPNNLGMGRYSVTVALHRNDSHLEGCFHWIEHACQFEVADSVAEGFQGRVRLYVDTRAEALDEESRLVVSDVTTPGSTSTLTIGRRNAALRDFRARLRADDAIDTVDAGADGLMRLTVRNSGDEKWGAYGRQPVHVAYHWLAPDGSMLTFDGLRTALPYDVLPGQQVQLPCFFRAPDVPGRAKLVWTLVQEEVAWFDEAEPASRLVQHVDVLAHELVAARTSEAELSSE